MGSRQSYHPKHIFTGIILSESKRLRRLNEKDLDYKNSIKRLEEKCRKSNFNKNIVNETINKVIIDWKKEDETKITKNKITKETKRITWTTNFKNLIKLNDNERKISPNTSITYKRPKTLQGWLTNYKDLGKCNKINQQGQSARCKKCSLCGGLKKFNNIVKEANKIITKYNKIIPLKENLNCKNYGIYQANCKRCSMSYIGQTKTNFTTRWTQHRSKWNKLLQDKTTERNQTKQTNGDEQALYKHYIKFHKNELQNLEISDAFEVLFITQPNYEKLDTEESYWISKIKADINISRTILPKFK